MKKLLKDKMLEMVLREFDMARRKKLQQVIENHYNQMIESYTSRITKRLDGLKFNYILEKSFDEEFIMFYRITIARINLEIIISKDSFKNSIVESEYENIRLLKVLVDVNDEVNQDDLEYIECRRIIKAVFQHIADKLSLELSTVRKLETDELFDLYELNYGY